MGPETSRKKHEKLQNKTIVAEVLGSLEVSKNVDQAVKGTSSDSTSKLKDFFDKTIAKETLLLNVMEKEEEITETELVPPISSQPVISEVKQISNPFTMAYEFCNNNLLFASSVILLKVLFEYFEFPTYMQWFVLLVILNIFFNHNLPKYWQLFWNNSPKQLYNTTVVKHISTIEKLKHSLNLPSKLNIEREDPYCINRGGEVLNMMTEGKEIVANINYKFLVKIMDATPVLSELDSDSHLSLISEDYFEKVLMKRLKKENYLNEKPPTFQGLGSYNISKYPPLKLEIQIGGVRLSGRFVVTNTLTTSYVLIGSDLMYKYSFNLISVGTNKYRVSIGYPVCGSVPCIVNTNKVTLTNTNKTAIVKKQTYVELYNDDQLEQGLEPGLLIEPSPQKNDEIVTRADSAEPVLQIKQTEQKKKLHLIMQQETIPENIKCLPIPKNSFGQECSDCNRAFGLCHHGPLELNHERCGRPQILDHGSLGRPPEGWFDIFSNAKMFGQNFLFYFLLPHFCSIY